MKSRKGILFGALICVATLSVAVLAMQGRQQPRFVPYTITWQMTEYHSDGRVAPTYTETRSNYSDGHWRSIIRFPNGLTVERIAEPGKGVFAVDQKTGERRFNSPFPERLRGDPLRHETWARTERLDGYRAEVLKFGRGEKSHELYHAPRLNNDIVKTVYRDKEVTRVLEPILLLLGEPAS